MTTSERNPSYFSSKIHSGWSKGRALRESGMGWNAMRTAYQGGWRRLGEQEGGCLRIRLTATAVCLCLATLCGRVGEWHLPHAAAMSTGWHRRLPRLPREEGLLHAASTSLCSLDTSSSSCLRTS